MSILTKLTIAQIKENKKRTALTALSIGLIVSLLTAIALFVSSAWVVMHDAIVENEGDWHFRTGVIQKSELNQLTLADFIEDTPQTVHVDTFTSDTLPKGRAIIAKKFTQELTTFGAIQYNYRNNNGLKQKEILIAGHLEKNDLIGKEVTFTNEKGQSMTYFVREKFYNYEDDTVDYIVVDETYESDNQIVFGKVSNFNNYFERFKTFTQSSGITFAKHNTQLLSMYLVTNNEVLNNLLKGVLPIVVIMIALISIMVISSSFTLSLNERLKQLGALSSVGTTRGQLVKMMLSESLIIGSLGILFGLIIGFVGSTIALFYFDQHAQVMFKASGLVSQFTLVVYWPLILLVVVLSACIIALSAIFPALKAARRSPIENIKQVPFKKFIQLKNRKQGSRRNVLAHVFKQPAYLAHRYKKHNSSRSRTVFFVLAISLLTFNVVSNLMIQVTDTLTQVANGGIKNDMSMKTDMFIYIPQDHQNDTTTYARTQQLQEQLKKIDGIEEIRYISTDYAITDQADLMTYLGRVDAARLNTDTFRTNDASSVQVVALDEKTEAEFLQNINVSPEQFKEGGVVLTTDILLKKKVNAIANHTLKGKIMHLNTRVIHEETTHYTDRDVKIVDNVNADSLSIGVSDTITVVVSHEMHLQWFPRKSYNILLKVNPEYNEQVDRKIREMIQSGKYGNAYVNNMQENLKVIRALLGMIQIIVYGFLGLISLVCLTAFYNTISSGVRLRRREFAMLQSIGMTKGQLRLMLSVENLTSGIIAIVLSAIGAYALTVFVNVTDSSSAREIVESMQYPLLPTLISSVTLLVMLVLFNSLTQRSVFKRSIVEDIKNETL